MTIKLTHADINRRIAEAMIPKTPNPLAGFPADIANKLTLLQQSRLMGAPTITQIKP